MKKEELSVQNKSSMVEFVPFGAKDKIKLSIAMVQNLVAVKTRSGRTCGENDAIKFIAMCKARLLNPFEGDAYLIGYDGKDGPTFSLITAHQAFLKRAEVNPEYDGMKSGIIVERGGELLDIEGDFHLEKDKLMGGWATVFFKTRKYPMHKRIRLQRFKKAFGIWVDDPAGMICKCAEADALRSSFPTMLGGMYLKEEVESHHAPQVSTPIFKPKEGDQNDDTVMDISATPEGSPPEEQRDSLVLVQNLCRKEKIPEPLLLACLKDINLADPEDEHLKDVEESAMLMVIEQWEDFLARIKKIQQEQQ
jgi:phage recombination protein Bet